MLNISDWVVAVIPLSLGMWTWLLKMLQLVCLTWLRTCVHSISVALMYCWDVGGRPVKLAVVLVHRVWPWAIRLVTNVCYVGAICCSYGLVLRVLSLLVGRQIWLWLRLLLMLCRKPASRNVSLRSWDGVSVVVGLHGLRIGSTTLLTMVVEFLTQLLCSVV